MNHYPESRNKTHNKITWLTRKPFKHATFSFVTTFSFNNIILNRKKAKKNHKPLFLMEILSNIWNAKTETPMTKKKSPTPR